MTLTRTPGQIVAEAEMGKTLGLLARHSTWERVNLHEIADIINGAPFPSKYFNYDRGGMPLIRIRDVGSNEPNTYYSGPYESDYLIQSGDILVGMDGDFRVAEWRGPKGLLNQRVCRIVVRNERLYLCKFLKLVLQGYLDAICAETSSITVKHLSSRSVAEIPLPLPPIAEQQRIVIALEDHLSRLDAGLGQVKADRRRIDALLKRVIVDAVPVPGPRHWQCLTVGEAGKVDLGRQRHPDWHVGPNMRPYLRVANVFEDRIDLKDVKEMDFPPDLFEHFKLHPGDILLNEGQSPEYLGRPAMYRGKLDEYAFTNSLLRFQAKADVLPEWALLVFRRHMHARRFIKEVRITTNIAHLSATRFKSVEFPIPPLGEQKRIVKETRELLDNIVRMSAALDAAGRRAEKLRQSVLAEAFSGRLVPQDPHDEPASALLERIRAERAAQPKPKRTRRAKNTNQETLL